MNTINAHDLKSLLESGKAILIDVRNPDEFAGEHIPYAHSVPLDQIDKTLSCLNIPTSTQIVFQCQKGKRGEMACSIFQDDRYTIANLGDGIEGWKQAGFQTISNGATNKISIFRQIQMIAGILIFILTLLGTTFYAPLLFLTVLIGLGLFVSGLTGFCGMALLLQKMPWNKA